MDKHLEIIKLLVSQPAPASDKSPFSELISRHSVDVVFRPFIEVEGVSLKEFRRQRIEIADHTAIIFTSRTAIDHFFRICEESRTPVPESLKYFCISEAIALYLQKYIVYRKRKIFFGAGTFPALMDIVVKHREEKYLVPLSEPHKPEIPIALTKANVNHNRVILSHTVSAKLDDLDLSQSDILALYTPADVKSLLDNFSEQTRSIKIATFGCNTARAALEAGISVDIMAPTPESPSMIMAIDKFIKAWNAGEDLERFALRKLPEIAPAVKNSDTSPRRTRKTTDSERANTK